MFKEDLLCSPLETSQAFRNSLTTRDPFFPEEAALGNEGANPRSYISRCQTCPCAFGKGPIPVLHGCGSLTPLVLSRDNRTHSSRTVTHLPGTPRSGNSEAPRGLSFSSPFCVRDFLCIFPAPVRIPNSMSLELCSDVYFLLLWQAWLCGGSVEILPCSRVGHIYQNQEAQSPRDQEATLRNKVRIAETWLGSFKETFYRHSPEAFSLSQVRRDPGRGLWARHGPPAGGWAKECLSVQPGGENKSFWLVLPLSCPS